ncbi:L,D-transpeptidase family protein [Hymenobacter sp. 102]|uniref:L,D-transpeptidase family protein n=1 Tax=Hymenobacter sp. 102 TaxID=3403152 RepID=UPI003CE75115
MRLFLLLTGALLVAARATTRPPEPNPAFRTTQQRFPRVRNAYALHAPAVHTLLRRHGVAPERLELFIRAFKAERRVEAWGRNLGQGQFVLLRTFRLAGTSGTLGPKRQAGDRQIPEGFYTINRFNPDSKYHLSLGLDYPNAADQQRAGLLDPGNDIFIHGSDETIGCLPITDAGIQELYLLAVEARTAGQTSIPVHIFPFALTANNLVRRPTSPHLQFWRQLAPGYEAFEATHEVPVVMAGTPDGYSVR